MSRHLTPLGYFALDAIQRGLGRHLTDDLTQACRTAGLVDHHRHLTDTGLDLLADAHYHATWPEGLPCDTPQP